MISIIIVNYNRKDLLKHCLDSVRAQSFRDIEIIAVDNASTDGSAEMITTHYPEAKLIKNTVNLLFCEAQNQGIEMSKGDFVLCLNSDCALDKDYLAKAVNAAEINENIGMVSGKILRMDKKIIDSTGLFLGRNRKAVERGYNKEDKGQYEKPGYIFGVSGAAAFFRKKMLLDTKDEYGYFDERFGMYYEDLDLCWRAKKKGWKAYYAPKAIVYHVRGGTAVNRGVVPRKGQFRRLENNLKKRYIINRYKCMIKNDTIASFLANLPFILWYDIKIWSYFAVFR